MAKVSKRTWQTAKGEPRAAWRVDFTDMAGARQRRQFETKREADAFRVEIEGQLRAGTFRPEAAKVTVGELAEQFLQYCEGREERGERMSRHHLEVIEGHVHNYLCPGLKRASPRKHPGKSKRKAFSDGLRDIKLGQLTARGVGDLRDRLRTAGVSIVTARRILSTLHNMLQYAISQDLIAVNVAHGLKVIGRRDEGAKKIVPPSKDDLRQVINAADPDFRVQLIFAAATGLRAGEHHALRWKHVNFETAELTVETRVDAYGQEDITKTAAGMRTVPLGRDVVRLIKEWHLRSKFKKPDDLVFPGVGGGYQHHRNVTKRKFLPIFEKLVSANAEDSSEPTPPLRFNWHALRHFAVSTWIEAGLSPKTVQTYAGHSSLQVTMDRYGHMFKSENHASAMDAIAKEIVR